MMERSPYEDLPETVRAAFAHCALLSLPQTAALLNMDRETLRRMLNRGDIAARQKGEGIKRPRFVFTIADIAKYLRSAHVNEARDSEGLAFLRSALSLRAPGNGTMNVSLVRRRRRPKFKPGPEKSNGGV